MMSVPAVIICQLHQFLAFTHKVGPYSMGIDVKLRVLSPIVGENVVFSTAVKDGMDNSC